jgi:hypothetical protein
MHSDLPKLHTPIRIFSRQVKTAEAYLRDVHPCAQIPHNILEEHLRDSLKQTYRTINPYQGELLALGVTRSTWDAAAGRKHHSHTQKYFVVFPSGKMRSTISTFPSEALINFRCCVNTMEDQGWRGRRNPNSMFGREVYS